MALFNVTKMPFARERVAVGGTAVALTPGTYNDSAANDTLRGKATGAKITVETASVRYCEDGSTPVATTGPGTLAPAGTQIVLESYSAIQRFKAIQESGAAALEVVYYR